mmetsp:Transcript_17025/g.28717  ORF Transcript_17025/g.28717 Transcript_17025/m.28717 type:complete len:204 (+) Transcript_17025:2760-3371(+)
MPAFLLEGLLVADAVGVQDGVEVDVHQIVEVLRVAGRDGVARAIRVGERVEESVQGALHQLHERLLDRVFAAPTQHAVLENVRDTRGILGRCAEYSPEGLVFIVVGQAHHLGVGLLVTEKGSVRVILGDKLCLQNFETVLGRVLLGRHLRRGSHRLNIQGASAHRRYPLQSPGSKPRDDALGCAARSGSNEAIERSESGCRRC